LISLNVDRLPAVGVGELTPAVAEVDLRAQKSDCVWNPEAILIVVQSVDKSRRAVSQLR
jgi:hypothetical protein